MLVSNSVTTTGSAQLYFALNPLPTRPTGHRNFAFFTDPGQVNLTILLAAAFRADLGLPNFQPLAYVTTLHVAIRLLQVYISYVYI